MRVRRYFHGLRHQAARKGRFFFGTVLCADMEEQQMVRSHTTGVDKAPGNARTVPPFVISGFLKKMFSLDPKTWPIYHDNDIQFHHLDNLLIWNAFSDKSIRKSRPLAENEAGAGH
jgi:hypothetical protein